MADTLKARLLDSDRRNDVVTDLELLIDQEVGDKSGLSGGVIKTGYATVKKLKPGIIWGAVSSMLDEVVDALEPYWTTCSTAATGDFGTFLSTRPEEVSEALLAITDRRAERSNRAAVTAVYSKLRPRGRDSVIEALPRLGKVIEKHAG